MDRSGPTPFQHPPVLCTFTWRRQPWRRGQGGRGHGGSSPTRCRTGDQLDEVVVQGDTGLGVEDGGVVVAVHVGGDNVVLSVAQDALIDRGFSQSKMISTYIRKKGAKGNRETKVKKKKHGGIEFTHP